MVCVLSEKPRLCLNLIRRLQAREERIVALETENAMLYLKLAQVNTADTGHDIYTD